MYNLWVVAQCRMMGGGEVGGLDGGVYKAAVPCTLLGFETAKVAVG